MLAARVELNRAGTEGGVWVEELTRGTDSRPYPDLRPGADAVLYHAGSYSNGITATLQSHPDRLLVYHLGFADADTWNSYDPRAGAELDAARYQLQALAPRIHRAFAASAAAAAELSGLGVLGAEVLPPFATRLGTRTERVASSADGPPTVVVAGPVVPHHRQLLAVSAIAALRAAGRPAAELLLVGELGPELYVAAVRRAARRLRVPLRFVVPAGPVDVDRELLSADVCLSCSLSPGPELGEALQTGVPLVAVRSGAAAEILGRSGALLDDDRPQVLGAVLARVLGDPGLAAELRRSSLERAADLEGSDRTGPLLGALER